MKKISIMAAVAALVVSVSVASARTSNPPPISVHVQLDGELGPRVVSSDRVERFGETRYSFGTTEVRVGAQYSLHIRNNTGQRQLACVAVDGINPMTAVNMIVDGRSLDARMHKDWGRGCLIVPPYSTWGGTAGLVGWQAGHKRRFKFTSVGASVANRFGYDLQGVGTITVAVFGEVEVRTMGPSGNRSASGRSMGTGEGQRHNQTVVAGEFNPKPIADEVIVLRYSEGVPATAPDAFKPAPTFGVKR